MASSFPAPGGGPNSGPGLNPTAQFVALSGNNANDGRTWSTAKKTILSAFDNVAVGGRIEYESGCQWSDGTEGGGVGNLNPIWITNNAVVPAGWRAHKPVRIVGINKVAGNGFASTPRAEINTAFGGDRFNPTVWLVGTCQGFVLENADFPAVLNCSTIRAGWDYPRNADGTYRTLAISSATRSAGSTVLSVTLDAGYAVTFASRSANVVTLRITAPQGSVPWGGESIKFHFTSTNGGLFASGDYVATAIVAGNGYGVIQYTDSAGDVGLTDMTGSTVKSTGVGVGDFLEITSTNAQFVSTVYEVTATTGTTSPTVTVTDPYGGSGGRSASTTQANIGTMIGQDRQHFASALFEFRNCHGRTGQNQSVDQFYKGPCVDLGCSAAGPWQYFYDCCWDGYASTEVRYDLNRVAAMFASTGGFTAIGANFILHNTKLQSGGLRAYLGNASVCYVNEMLMDTDTSVQSPPPIEIFAGGASSFATVNLNNVQSADNSTNVPNVILHGTSPASTLVQGCGLVEGPCTYVGNNTAAGWGISENSPGAIGIMGFWPGGVAGYHPAVTRAFGVGASRLQNFIPEYGSWTTEASATLTPGQADPSGGTRAIKIHPTDPIGVNFFNLNINTDPNTSAPITWTVGDRMAFFMYAKPTAGTFANFTFRGIIEFDTETKNGHFLLTASPFYAGDGGWQFFGGTGVIATVDDAAAGINCSVEIPTGHDVVVYQPVWYYCPAGTMTDSEWGDFVESLHSTSQYLKPGMAGTAADQKLIAHGGLGMSAGLAKTVGVASGQLTLTGSGTTYVPVYAADGTTIQGWVAQLQATVNP